MPNNTNASTANKVEKDNNSSDVTLSKKEATNIKLALAIGGLAGIVSHSKNPLVLGVGLVISSCACLWSLDKLNEKDIV